MRSDPLTRLSGFTILELIVSIAILLILASLIATGYRTVAPRVSKARCINNMRQIHVALSNHLNDRNYWPQVPDSVKGNNKSYEDWWISALEPYGTVDEVWLCPVLKALRIKDSSGYQLRMHYIPSEFDASPMSPRRWPNMPWVVERGNNHGSGALALFQDGATRPWLPK